MHSETARGVKALFRRIGETLQPPGRISRKVLLIGSGSVVVTSIALLYYSLLYLPSQTSEEPEMQTAIARQGDLVISASGSGTLVSRNEVDLAFQTAGEVTKVLTKVGAQVTKGEVLAQVDDEDAKIQVAQARRALQDLTSDAAIATALGDIASARVALDEAKGHLAYLISPPVYYWENELAEREAVLAAAQAKAAENPGDGAAQAAVTEAQKSVEYAQKNLGGAQYSYEHTYIKNNFTVTAYVDKYTGKVKKYVEEPSEAEILTARADVAEAAAALEEASYYYAALTEGDVPSYATGNSLTALEDAKANVETAQSALDGTQIVATIDGTVMSLDTSVGDTVKSGTALITVADLSIPYLECYLDESDWQNVKTDADVDVTFDILEGQTFKGQVTQVDPGLYTQSNSSVVRAYVEIVGDEAKTLNLPLGTTAAVEIIGARADNALLIPLEALHKTDSGTYAVFVVENGTPTLRIVEIGIQDLLYAEVKSGLSAGDIVTTGIMETQ